MKYISLIILCLCIIGIKSDNAQKVIDYAKKHLGCGYCWGTLGQRLTEKLLNQLVQTHGADQVHPDYQRTANMGKIVFDCAGLVAKAFNEIGIRPPTGATKAWKALDFVKKGEISGLPKDRVAILYRGDGTKMSHTGIYIKGDKFIHAKGYKFGVIEESMSAFKWTHYGIPKGLYEPWSEGSDTPIPETFPFQAKVIAKSGSTVNLRNSPGGKVIKKIKLGEKVTVTGEKNGWYQITYGNINGYMMKEFLEKL